MRCACICMSCFSDVDFEDQLHTEEKILRKEWRKKNKKPKCRTYEKPNASRKMFADGNMEITSILLSAPLMRSTFSNANQPVVMIRAWWKKCIILYGSDTWYPEITYTYNTFTVEFKIKNWCSVRRSRLSVLMSFAPSHHTEQFQYFEFACRMWERCE